MKAPKIPTDFTHWWARTEEGQAAIAEAAEVSVGERQADIDRLGEIDAEVLKAIVGPKKAIEKGAAEVLKAREALLAKEQKLAEARMKDHNVRHRADTERARIELRLKEGAHPAVPQFLDDIMDLWERERKEWRWIAPRDRDDQPILFSVRVKQIRVIQEQAEALFFVADPDVVEAELEKLKAAIATPQEAAVA